MTVVRKELMKTIQECVILPGAHLEASSWLDDDVCYFFKSSGLILVSTKTYTQFIDLTSISYEDVTMVLP